MRNNIVYSGADELTYEIREIVAVAKKVESMGVEIAWENIGDPVQKGHKVPVWIKEIVRDIVMSDDTSFGYSPTKGLLETREFIAKERNKKSVAHDTGSKGMGGAKITAEDILFFNGLGDAISRVYSNLNEHVRVIGPNPAYSTHSSAEASHASSSHITYRLDPHRNWTPDLQDLRNKVKYNPAIGGILIINPDNPTGIVYSKEVLLQIVAIAREFDLFIVADEIYANIVYGGAVMTALSDVIDDVPGMAMKGLSKEVPWPGARCGWVEFYNTDKDPIFARYVKSLVDAKMLEVCSTTLPQKALPKILSDKRYAGYLAENNLLYNKRAELFYKTFSKVSGVTCVRPQGALYATVVFDEGVLGADQTMTIEDAEVKKYIEQQVVGIALDKRFVYYLLSSTGICVVPLSGFNSDLPGFRITLLEVDDVKFKKNLDTIAEAIKNYLKAPKYSLIKTFSGAK
ncbi:TPA: aminotransferase [Candidatus Taylorbacteria bacterium]|nr:aminotransferase [Candidatus Taylorbacteria bacterium]